MNSATFWSKVDQSGGPDACWPWTGFRNAKGYGRCSVEGVQWIPHRLAYSQRVGPIPAGMTVDHMCFNPPCCNPAHLRLLTHGENSRTHQVPKTHCPKGHPYDDANTRTYQERDWTIRVCRRCNADAAQRSYRRAKARREAARV